LIQSEEATLLGRTAVAVSEEVRGNFDCACARKKIVPGTRLATLEATEIGAEAEALDAELEGGAAAMEQVL
jgi:hypothetical protein